MKLIKKIVGLVVLVLGMCMINVPFAQASEFNFAVTPIIPSTQLDLEKTYFDLKLDPGQEEKLEVLLRNDTDKKVEIDVSVNSATTNSNVIVEYGENEIEKDESLEFDLKDYVEYPEALTLQPNSERIIEFKAKMPKEKFDGVLAGGITFKEIKKEQEKNDEKEQGLSIKNEYSYVVALLMRQNENEVAPDLKLKKVEPGQINARNVILSTIQNDKKTYINQVAVQAKITKKGDSEVLYKEDKEGLQIAPNSNFSFPISLKGAALEPGDYHLSMTVYGNKEDEGEFVKEKGTEALRFKNQWKFEQDFTIDGETAKELNEKDVSLKKDNTWLYILAGSLLLLLVVLLIIWLVWRKKKNEEEKV
ncbi:hypothetical protein IGI57_000124 [Enterococcus sp. DIV0213j]